MIESFRNSKCLFCKFALSDILNGKKNYLFFPGSTLNFTGIQKHDTFADCREDVFNFKVVECCFFWKDCFEQFSQFRNIPLVISQIIYKSSNCFTGSYPEEIIEWLTGFNYS